MNDQYYYIYIYISQKSYCGKFVLMIYIYIYIFYYLFIYFLLNCTNDILYDNDLFKTNFLEISKHALKFKVMH